MKLSELIEKLKGIEEIYGGDMLVVSQKDSEGNGYSPVVGACEGYYEPETTWGGFFYDQSEFEDCDIDPDTELNAVVVWPVN